MNYQAICLIKNMLPEGVLHLLRPIYHGVQRVRWYKELRETQRIFAASPDTPAFLDRSLLPDMQRHYQQPSFHLSGQGGTTQTRNDTGHERAMQLLSMPGASSATEFLEIGCGDGLVSHNLARQGKTATAIDQTQNDLDGTVLSSGVRFSRMDAENIQFSDNSFDFVFSFNAFEHFSSPEKVLREAIRLVRKGGYIYLEFAPLYYAPYGEHAWLSISVPYCQFLWTKQDLQDFCREQGCRPIDFSHVNGWSLDQYRDLWKRYEQALKKVRYIETFDPSHLSMIRKYPACFKSKSKSLENFIVLGIGVLFRKK